MAMDVASSHLGKVARELKKAKEIEDKHWPRSAFEAIADKTDWDDETLSGTCEREKLYKT